VPWSQVVLDGRVLGNTPIVNAVVPAGAHRLVLRPADGSQHTFTVIVRAGETTRVVRNLR
jgi:hypothetical protein